MPDRTEILGQVDRLVSSHTLHGSESLCKLLRYLAKHALDQPGVSLKEYQIATEVFGRQDDFDPQVDSAVRVQAGRLRSKLAEYYASEGAEDTIIVELPKGMYVLSFHPRSSGNGRGVRAAGTGGLDASHDAAAVPSGSFPSGSTRWAIVAGVLGVLLLGALVAIGGLLGTRRSASAASAANGDSAPAALQIFWHGFLTSSDEPWVIFSNAAFVGHPDTGLRYYDAKRDTNAVIFDHYTGVGEVLAVHNLDIVFESLHQRIRVKRGSLFSLDDAKNNDLIFIGSPSENLTLLEIPGTKDFVFREVPSGPRKGNMEVMNVRPERGEATSFLATAANQPLIEDYAVVALVRGLNPAHSQLILAGTTTIGTQAAVEYVTRQSFVEELLQRLSVTQPSELKPFEALLRVKVARGVPVGTELVALRKAN
ncbi:MAG TPA: hypothetical protein VOA78_01535 [Candidatus Dormibacteraeota bacterium]|nr:hypothetical protein [Candidatus Dormibacteraeota bacterium]